MGHLLSESLAGETVGVLMMVYTYAKGSTFEEIFMNNYMSTDVPIDPRAVVLFPVELGNLTSQ